MLEISPAIARQYIDAVSTFEALEEAQEEAAQVRGGMYWHAGPTSAPDAKYLVRTTPAGAETSLGTRTPENVAIYERFTQRKRESAERVSGLKAALDSSMLGVLKKVDNTFRIRKSQKYTAVNKDGFEVDIIRRERAGDDPHPVKLSDEDDDFWVVQARRANMLLDSPGFSAVIVASNGTMARMNTVHPATFVAFKRWMAAQPDREALKRRRDVLQADAVQELLNGYLPQV
jgi:hypothetical protein